MVENLVNDGVEPKPAIIEASVDVKVKVKIHFHTHIEVKPEPTGVVAKLCGYEVNIASFFLINERWRKRDDLLGWVRRHAARA